MAFFMENPLGIFDSGIGGLTLLPAITSLLPHENILYVADEAHSPYGKKSHKELLHRSRLLTKELIKRECKLIVVACNTATTQVIKQLRDEFLIPFVGIEPGLKQAAEYTTSKVVGVLATEGTLNSSMYRERAKQYEDELMIIEQVGHQLVNWIEEKKINTTAMQSQLQNYITPMLTAGMDTFLLGCTHYPYLIPLLQELLPPQVKIMDNSAAIAQQIQRLLKKHKIVSSAQGKGIKTFYSTGKKNNLTHFVTEGVTHLPL